MTPSPAARSHLRRHFFAWLGAAGLLAAMLPSELLLWPHALEPAGRVLYRVAFWIAFIPLMAAKAALRGHGHHWPSVGVLPFICLVTSYGYWMVGAALLARRRYRALRLEANAPAIQPPTSSEEETQGPPAAPARAPAGLGFGRREFFVWTGRGALAVAGGVGAYASLIEPQRLQLRRYVAPIADLAPALEGLRVVQISDTHYGPMTALAYLEHAVAMANDLKPDLVALTGDYVHKTPRAIAPGIAMFRALRPRLGTVAVLGNHDHWEGAPACREAFARLGVPLIDNRRLFLGAGGISSSPLPDSLCVAGVGDLWEDEVLLEQALDGVPESMPRLLLSHNPDVAETLARAPRVDLMLSGHTHGGQVAFPGIGAPIAPTSYGPKYLGGLCQGPRCPVIVSRGVGMAIMPVRFRVPPEIALIELRRA